jgi:hypothetical protein
MSLKIQPTLDKPFEMISTLDDAGAHFNAERTRRYLLWRRVRSNDDLPWNKGKDFVLFIGLNPSIADETRLDPTVTRCFKFAERWGYHFLLMGNLYSKISTDPKGVNFHAPDLDDQMNNGWELSQAIELADCIVLAWGTHADEDKVRKFLRTQRLNKNVSFHCLGVNVNGSPKHPLYLKGDTMSVLYEADLK